MDGIISVHIGQAGVNLGHACWTQFSKEFPLDSTGQLTHNTLQAPLNLFYSEVSECTYKPRALFVDSDRTSINSLLSSNGSRYDNRFTFSSNEDSGGTFAAGKYILGKECIDELLEKLRVLSENCGYLKGFFIYFSTGGGTGSGISSCLLESLKIQFPGAHLTTIPIYPSKLVPKLIIEGYNSSLSTLYQSRHANSSMLLHNKSLYNICKTQLNISVPKIEDLNHLAAVYISSVTCCSRFNSSALSMNDISEHLSQAPQQKFFTLGHSSVLQSENVDDIAGQALNTDNFTVEASNNRDEILSTYIAYRGDLSDDQITQSTGKWGSKKIKEIENWRPTLFKDEYCHRKLIGFNDQVLNVSAGSLNLHHGIADFFKGIKDNLELLYAKRAYMHIYVTKGMEEGEVTEADEELSSIENIYQYAENSNINT